MKRVTFVLVAAMLASCAHGGQSTTGRPLKASAGRFHYDGATGKCVDGAGRSGLNALDAKALLGAPVKRRKVYKAGNAECVDFSKFDFSRYLGLGYSTLAKWNLRGAKFTGARFMFANMDGVDVRGADMSGLRIGYTTLSGQGDAHTKPPKGATCKVSAEYKVTCRQ